MRPPGRGLIRPGSGLCPINPIESFETTGIVKKKIMSFSETTTNSEKSDPGGAAAVDRYEIFAEIYDEILKFVPYSTWADYLLERAGVRLDLKKATVLDLACGTGILLSYLKRRVGVAMGLDRSWAMLKKAKRKNPELSFFTGLLEGPLDLESGRFDWVVCTHDSINYITSGEGLLNHFQEVFRILKNGGIYSMDAVSLTNLQLNFNQQKPTRSAGSWTLDWSNHFDERTGKMESHLRFTGPDQTVHEEVHHQKYYAPEEIRRGARMAGFELIAMDQDYSIYPLEEPTSMTNYHFRKVG